MVVIAGNNKFKTNYIKASVDSGLNVLADKPMAIDTEGFNTLVQAFESAEKNKVLLYDIMTERYEIRSFKRSLRIFRLLVNWIRVVPKIHRLLKSVFITSSRMFQANRLSDRPGF